MTPVALAILAALPAWRAAHGTPPLVVGVCGPQGSGKSTAATAVAADLAQAGLTAAVLSLDDLYLGRAARRALAAAHHPLLATRGPPGTHDLALGLATLGALRLGARVRLPRFDKGRDEPAPKDDWPVVAGRCDVVIFEGWCIGARPQADTALAVPVNALERDADAGGVWRRYVNHRLADYAPLFAVDRLVCLLAPDFADVAGWRREAEHALIAAAPVRPPAAMDDAAIDRFVAHFERITRHIAADMPARADLTIRLDRDRTVVSVARGPSPPSAT